MSLGPELPLGVGWEGAPMGAGLRAGPAPGEAWGSSGQGGTPGPPSREIILLGLPLSPS